MVCNSGPPDDPCRLKNFCRNPLTGLSGLQPLETVPTELLPVAGRNPLTGLSGLQRQEGRHQDSYRQYCRNPLTGLSGLQLMFHAGLNPNACKYRRNPLTGLSGLQHLI